ncbi:MAG TPA: M20/M25/M40 family metallo-hydrolase [Myxococcales bacterium]|nr:M20/M25/M40 family metallo-hydrolase [Myxococcales bacterium]
MRALWMLVLLALPALAQERRDPRVEAIVQRIDSRRLQATVKRLTEFGTRHTLSGTQGPGRGIVPAREWLAGEFAAAAKGSRLKPFEDRFTAPANGKRIPAPVEIVNVGAVLPGSGGGRKAIVMTGHYDSMPSDVMDPKTDAPGAIDDASGTAMALELAGALKDLTPALSVYLVAVAGEEQGLIGSQHLAERLKAEGVEVVAMVSVDIAGNSEGQDGVRDGTAARLFSEGTPEIETEAEKKLRLAVGNENDSPAREWARYLQRVGELYVSGLRLRVMLRRDRIARGSDHMSFSHLGFPAIRLSEAREDYRGQHQTPRTEDGVRFGDELFRYDAGYSARMCKALAAAIASLSLAPLPPQEVTLLGAVSPDAKLRWKLPDDGRIADVILYRRPADAVAWERALSLGKVSEVTLPSVTTDDWFFAVATADAAGNQSIAQPPAAVGR